MKEVIPVEFRRVLGEAVAALKDAPENRVLAVCEALHEGQCRDLRKARRPSLARMQRMAFRGAVLAAYMPKLNADVKGAMPVPAEDWPRFVRIARCLTEIAVGGLVHRGNTTLH